MDDDTIDSLEKKDKKLQEKNELYYHVAMWLKCSGKYDKAQETFQEILEFKPYDRKIQNFIKECKSAQGLNVEALEFIPNVRKGEKENTAITGDSYNISIDINIYKQVREEQLHKMLNSFIELVKKENVVLSYSIPTLEKFIRLYSNIKNHRELETIECLVDMEKIIIFNSNEEPALHQGDKHNINCIGDSNTQFDHDMS